MQAEIDEIEGNLNGFVACLSSVTITADSQPFAGSYGLIRIVLVS